MTPAQRAFAALSSAMDDLVADAVEGCTLESVILYGTYSDLRSGYIGDLRRSISPDDLRALIERSGFQVRVWDDVDDGTPGFTPHWGPWIDVDPQGEWVGDIKIQVRAPSRSEPSIHDIELPPDQLRIEIFRTAGVAGNITRPTQNVVRITHLPTGLVAIGEGGGSQMENKRMAMEKLLTTLAERQ